MRAAPRANERQTSMTEPTRYTRKSVGIDCSQDGRTKQSMQGQCDINRIMQSYDRTSTWTHVNARMPTYGDFSNIATYQEALNTVNDAHDLFMELPSAIRTQFENDPAQYLDFVANDDNVEEAIKMGLLPDPNARVVETPQVETDPQGKSGATPPEAD